ncbi:TPA: hypothetical protein PXQ47_002581 [Yersinia enterocolitica]|nr:hypothetical protein [Yersinia enterocolitica]
MMAEIKETKDVWLTVTNSDLTEGRGRPVILYVCDSPVTAARLGKKKSVQGSDADTIKATAVKIGTSWLVPWEIVPESDADKVIRKKNEALDQIIEKMREKGFSSDEIAALTTR